MVNKDYVLTIFIIIVIIVGIALSSCGDAAPTPTKVEVVPTPTVDSGFQIVNRHYDPEYDVVCFFIATDMECLKANKKK